MSPLRSGTIASIAVVMAANALFLALMMVFQGDPKVTADRTRSAFGTGELSTTEYLPNDSRRGWHQYNDCNILQMISNENPSRVDKAVAPNLYFLKSDTEYEEACDTLYALTVDHVNTEKTFGFRYARYWHGYLLPVALGLEWVELATLRRALSALVWLAIACVGLSAIRAGPRTRRTRLAIALTAGFLWSVPYFAPGLSSGPGDAVLLLALCVPALVRRSTTDFRVLLPYAAGFGALVVFFEMLTGQLVIAAAWLVALTLAIARDEQDNSQISPLVAATSALVAFAVGGIATAAAKQLIARIAEPDAGNAFVDQLRYYMAVPKSAGGVPGILLPFVDLSNSMSTLTYWNRTAGGVLTAAMLLGLIAAALKGFRQRRSDRGRDIMFLVGLSLLPAVWALLLPTHTHIHATFMVRMLVVPISLAPLALCWPRGREPLRSSIQSEAVPAFR